ncbi:MAG: hypothetical protein AB1297_06775 [bacterium]
MARGFVGLCFSKGFANTKTEAKPLLAFLILLICGVLYFFEAATLRGFWITGDLGYSDLTDYYFPLKCYLGECLKDFSLPLWCPYVLSGIPILSEGEIGAFHPLNLIFFFILDPSSAYNITTIASFLIAGFSIFLFCQTIGLKFFPSILSSISFTFSGYLITHLKHPSNLMTVSFFPFLFYFAERFIQEGKLYFAITGGIILSLQVFSGHPQIMVYTNFALSLYFFFRFIIICLEERKKKKRKFLPLFLKLLFIPLILVIGFSLSACQLFPTFELLKHSGRRLGEAIHELERFPFHPKELINFILPYFYGDPAYATYKTQWNSLFWENTGYIGILPLIASFLSLFWIRKNRYILFFGTSFFFFLLLSFGKYSPFLFLLKMSPFSSYRFPNRFLLLVDFSLAILAGFGIQLILEKIKNFSMKTIAYIVVIIITFLDLYRFGAHHNPCVLMKDWKKIPEVVKFLKSDKDIFRVYSIGSIISRNTLYYKYGWLENKNWHLQNRETLSVNTNAIYHLSSPGVYLTLFPLRPFIFEMKLADGFILNSQTWTGNVSDSTIKLLSLLNVKYLVSCFSLQGQGIELVKEIPLNWDLPPVKIYRNNHVFERAFLVPSAKMIYDPNTIIDEILKADFNPGYEVILEEEAPKGSFSIFDSICKMEDYKADYVKIACEMKENGFLFLSDSHYPGWKAYVRQQTTDNRQQTTEVKIYYANCAFRAVFLNKGRYNVEFIYKPWSFYNSSLIK